MGDFNDLLSIDDKSGKVDHPPHLFRGFRDAVSDCGLIDVKMSGYRFTWERGRGSSGFVQQRLDRAMGNNAWHDLFPNARLLNLVAPCSDHNPILLELIPGGRIRRVQRFKFENK